MSRCSRCGAPQGGTTLHCAYCGAATALEEPRLLEAICIETVGDVALPVIRRGAPLPASYSDSFGAAEHGQRQVQARLVLGNAPQASHNRPLARLILPLSRPVARGDHTAQLTVSVEPDGKLRMCLEEIGAPNRLVRDDLYVPVARTGST